MIILDIDKLEVDGEKKRFLISKFKTFKVVQLLGSIHVYLLIDYEGEINNGKMIDFDGRGHISIC